MVDGLPVDVEDEGRERVLRVRAFGLAAGALEVFGGEAADAVTPVRVGVVELLQCFFGGGRVGKVW